MFKFVFQFSKLNVRWHKPVDQIVENAVPENDSAEAQEIPTTWNMELSFEKKFLISPDIQEQLKASKLAEFKVCSVSYYHDYLTWNGLWWGFVLYRQ